MAGQTLTTASVLLCPHGGKVVILSSHALADACGNAIATVADTFLIASCPYVIPGLFLPSPCLTVKWLGWDAVMSINGSPTLSQTSPGLCFNAAQVPQGPVIFHQIQPCLSTQ